MRGVIVVKMKHINILSTTIDTISDIDNLAFIDLIWRIFLAIIVILIIYIIVKFVNCHKKK